MLVLIATRDLALTKGWPLSDNAALYVSASRSSLSGEIVTGDCRDVIISMPVSPMATAANAVVTWLLTAAKPLPLCYAYDHFRLVWSVLPNLI